MSEAIGTREFAGKFGVTPAVKRRIVSVGNCTIESAVFPS